MIPGFPSTYFETNNRGVKSVTLNLKTPEGREILRKLVATADIFGQNFRPGAAEKNGFGYEELRKVNPRLVYMSVSGYGPEGPHADLPGTDLMAQALGVRPFGRWPETLGCEAGVTFLVLIANLRRPGGACRSRHSDQFAELRVSGS